MKELLVLLFMAAHLSQGQQPNTDIYLVNVNFKEGNLTCSEPLNITNRAGYDNQPSFSNNGRRIYYSANYTGTNDIYFYDIPTGKTFTITNTPATSEFSPMETPDSRAVTAVFIEKDSVTQRLWNINLRTRKEKVFGANHDSIGYYWPIDNELGTGGGMVVGGSVGVRTVMSAEYDVAVYVLGKKEGESTLRIIDPFRKPRPEKILDDSVGRCIRQVVGKHTLTYVKKTPRGNYLKFYDLWQRKVVAEFYLSLQNEDYCWRGTTLLYSDETMIKAVSFAKGFDQPQDLGALELLPYGIKNIKRLWCYDNQVAFVADDK